MHQAQLEAKHPTWDESNITALMGAQAYFARGHLEAMLGVRCQKCGREVGEHTYTVRAGVICPT